MNEELKKNGFDRIKIELREVYEAIERAARENELPVIERDIVLDRLRGVYAMLKTATVPENEEGGKSKDESGPLPEAVPTEKREAKTTAPKCEIEFVGRAVLPENEIPFSVNRPWDRHVIDSLYGDGGTCRKNDPAGSAAMGDAYVVSEDVPETETMRPGEPAPVAFPMQVQDAPEADPGIPGAVGGKGKVLGEVMAGNNRQTVLNEAVSGKDGRPDLASVLSSRTVSDIRKSIGINDRFLLMRDLFGNDAALYDRTMDALNGCGSFEDACIYLQENFVFDPEREGIKLLVSLLERKFS